ncbi:MAG: autotransporter outer membrane beta-barrel domain-containing protein, partial [Gammaproteobacteria bacterium]|nr:autotransporter outer membrane beta-barrel domain-containing protein [Gammaproteobacteria bacterium]
SYDGVSAEVAVAVSDNDEDVSGASTAWMARFGRVVSEQILEGIGDRVGARRQLGASPPQDGSNSAAVSFEAMFAGQRLGDGSLAPQRLDGGAGFGGLARPGPGMLSTQPPVGGSSIWPAPVFGADGPSGALPPTGGPREDRSLGSMMRAALVNSAFNASGQTSGGAAWGVWGRGSVAALEGRSADGISIDGDVTTGQLGADWAINNWLLGLSASYSQGDGDYAGPDGRGALESTMAALTPYLSVDAGRFSAWGALSTGRGDMTVIPQQGLAVKADIEMEMGAVGLRGELLDFGDGFSLSLISDAMAMRSSSEAATGMPAAEADASRVRAAVEASWTRPLAGGGRFSARLEGGARLDGGDAEEGAGAEVSAGLSWMQDGLIFELEGRHLIAHEDEDFSQTGASAHLAWNSQPSSGLGPSLSVRQHWGIATASGLDQLFALRDLGQFGLESGGRRLDTEIGWGLPLLGGRFAGTPFLLHGAQDGGSLQTLGWRMEPLDLGGKAMDMSMSFKLMRRARIADGPDRGVALEARVGF